MNRRQFLRTAVSGAAALALTRCASAGRSTAARKPNFVVILADDQGYRDVGCFDAPLIETPNLDRMAAEGMRFTDFYSAAPVCTPSRAALMTGCYPQRVGLPGVLGPQANTGIHADEVTMADLLKGQGYATACFGKWHLGHHPEFLPTRHGFDEYFGLPYSNDMWPNHPTSDKYPPLPLIEGETIIEYNPDQTQLTTWYTERAVRFITENKDNPFFLYLPHNMPHVPLFVSDKFRGKSKQGLYGDVIMEIDWSAGQILDTLRTLGLDDDTVVVFTSDNGPWLSYGDHAGSALPLREGKGTTFDGGQREPCIMWGPSRIPAGTICTEMCVMFDLLPTFASLTGAVMPSDRVIDGKNIWPLMSGKPKARTPHEAFYFCRGMKPEAVRSGDWKLHLPHAYRSCPEPGTGGQPRPYIQKKTGTELYDLSKDIAEQTDVSADHPHIVEKLSKLAQQFNTDLRKTRRPPGKRPRSG